MNATEEMPSYGKAFSTLVDAFPSLLDLLLLQLSRAHRIVNCVSRNEVLVVGVLTLLLALARSVLVRKVVLTVCSRYKLPPGSHVKMEENCWKFCFYLLSTLWTFYWTAVANDFFQQPSKTLLGVNPDSSIKWSFKLLYAFQVSFYIHGSYTVFFLDEWKSDSTLLFFHHIDTLLMLVVSYVDRLHYIGSLIILCHDVNDIFLMFGKISGYLKYQNGKFIKMFDIAAFISLIIFTLSWFLSRLYYFPLKAVYTLIRLTEPGRFEELRFSSTLLTMNLLLLTMNVYWSVIICNLLFRIATGKMKEFNDPREYETQEHPEKVVRNGRKSD